jgi:hypothetical protein
MMWIRGLDERLVATHMGSTARLTARIASDRRKKASIKSFLEKLLTVGNLLHIWPFTDETWPSGLARSRFTYWYIRCPCKTGVVKRRLFDIVGTDEGTCGRRLRSGRVLRPVMIG